MQTHFTHCDYASTLPVLCTAYVPWAAEAPKHARYYLACFVFVVPVLITLQGTLLNIVSMVLQRFGCAIPQASRRG